MKFFQFAWIASLFTILFVISCRHYFSHELESYALTTTQKRFGTLPLALEKEEEIRKIAEEMKVTTPFIIRTMNRDALILYGYHNAFAYFPQFLDFIPISDTAFLFISDGFFEDLSKEEQRFLIGHELTHIQEHHTQYLSLIMLVTGLLVGMLLFVIRRRTKGLASHVALFLVCCTLITARNLGNLYYRRHIEKVADHESLTKLKSHDGALALIERWQKEFNLPLHNSYYGLLADHPSCHERKSYCLNLKNQSKDIV